MLSYITKDSKILQELFNEGRKRKALVVDPLLVTLSEGDMAAAVYLSQVIFWECPDKEGRSKLRVGHNGKMWIAKSDAEWAEELGIKETVVRRVRNFWKRKLIVETIVKKFIGTPVVHVRINRAAFNAETEKNIEAFKSQFVDSGCYKSHSDLNNNSSRLDDSIKSLTDPTSDPTSDDLKTPLPPSGGSDGPKAKSKVKRPKTKLSRSTLDSVMVNGETHEVTHLKNASFVKIGRMKYYLPRILRRNFWPRWWHTHHSGSALRT